MKITYQILVTRIQYCSVLLPIRNLDFYKKSPQIFKHSNQGNYNKEMEKLFLKLSERVQNKTVREVKKKTGMEEK